MLMGKKHLALGAAAACLAATAAVAAVTLSTGHGDTRAAACQAAKANGEQWVLRSRGATPVGSLDGFGTCECGEGQTLAGRWTCQVEVHYTPTS
jgi:hypothetical protein